MAKEESHTFSVSTDKDPQTLAEEAKKVVGLLRFGVLVETWQRRSTKRRKDAENQTTVSTGVSP